MTGTACSVRDLTAVLGNYGIEDAPKECEIILTECLGMDRVGLYRDNPVLSERQQEILKEILRRRNRREPLHYIIGHVNFCGLDIRVGPGVLIPRPETELLVEEVIKTVSSRQSAVDSQRLLGCRRPTADGRLKILDLCTGSGCIGLALAKRLPLAEVFATDRSDKALAYAGENARASGIGNVTFLKGDLFEPVKGMWFDIIVSNPPYIRTSDIRNLQPEIREWEPLEALDGGRDGLAFYRKILSLSGEYLNDHGCILMEMGAGEAEGVRTEAERFGFTSLTVTRDYSGIERVLRASYR